MSRSVNTNPHALALEYNEANKPIGYTMSPSHLIPFMERQAKQLAKRASNFLRFQQGLRNESDVLEFGRAYAPLANLPQDRIERAHTVGIRGAHLPWKELSQKMQDSKWTYLEACIVAYFWFENRAAGKAHAESMASDKKRLARIQQLTKSLAHLEIRLQMLKAEVESISETIAAQSAELAQLSASAESSLASAAESGDS